MVGVNHLISNGVLEISVKENPIIQNIIFEGIKSSTILEELKKRGSIDYCQKFGKLICWTDIYLAF